MGSLQGAGEQWANQYATANAERDWADQFGDQFADGTDPNQWMEEFAQDMDARTAATAQAGTVPSTLPLPWFAIVLMPQYCFLEPSVQVEGVQGCRSSSCFCHPCYHVIHVIALLPLRRQLLV